MDVFISYKHENGDCAENVISRLEHKGFQTRTDQKIGAGEEWRAAIDLTIKKGDSPYQQTAWYHKQQATWTFVFAAVRRHLWGNFRYATFPQNPDVMLLPHSDLAHLADIVCSSA